MEDYRLDQSGQEVQDILNGAAMQSDLTAETERATEAEQTLQDNIDAEATRAQGAEGTLQDNIDTEEARAKAAEKQNADDIDAIEEKIPSGASSSNKLATEEYVADAVATATATFRGTYNLVSDLHLNVTATEQQISAALAGAISTADNNDYCFILVPTSSETPTEIKEIDRYKFNGTAWAFEYKLNNSGFNAAQWAAINSGITSGDVAKLAALPTNAQLTTLLAGLQSDIDGEEARAKGAEGTLQDNIDAEETRAKAAEKQNADDIDAIEAVLPENASSENKVATESEIDSLSAAIEAILLLIPSAATSLNKLADKAFVNSSIATATATFRGTYNLVDDLGLTTSATHAQIATALAGAILTADNNDYAFVQIPTSDAMPTEIAKTERYKFNGTAWEYEYDLNNSGFTADQWAAINSGITQALVTKLSALPTNAELTTELGTLTSGINTINQKIPNAASQANKLVDTAAMESYIVQVLDVLTASFNVTSTDGHVTVQISQVDGKITSVAVSTSDIASAADLNLKASQADLTALASRVTTAEGNITTLGGRMTTAESNITSLGGRMTTAESNITSLGGRMTTAESNITSLGVRVSTNETDIANLQQLYNDLQQSKPVPVTALPETGQQQGVIYRLAGTTSYSDYMWNGSTWVLMATYNNAIDPRPKKASQNLVTSGGVFDNMGALDVSELNATENPHTLAQYTDLSAALAAIPTDYQKGGMSIKFVQSSDNKYVQFRLTKHVWSTTVTDWENVSVQVANDGANDYYETVGVVHFLRSQLDIKSNYNDGFAEFQNASVFVEDGVTYINAAGTDNYNPGIRNDKVVNWLKSFGKGLTFRFSAKIESGSSSAMMRFYQSGDVVTLFELTTDWADYEVVIPVSSFSDFKRVMFSLNTQGEERETLGAYLKNFRCILSGEVGEQVALNTEAIKTLESNEESYSKCVNDFYDFVGAAKYLRTQSDIKSNYNDGFAAFQGATVTIVSGETLVDCSHNNNANPGVRNDALPVFAKSFGKTVEIRFLAKKIADSYSSSLFVFYGNGGLSTLQKYNLSGDYIECSLKLSTEQFSDFTRLQFTMQPEGSRDTCGFYLKNVVLIVDGKIEARLEDVEKRVAASPIAGKKVSIIGDSISTIAGNNNPFWKVISVDVGNEIHSYVTWWDVWADKEGTIPTGKTIGGVTLTAEMIGTLQAFTPVAGDVGKQIGVPANYNAVGTKVWSERLCELAGATLLANASWSGARMCSGQTGIWTLSEAWSDYTIGCCETRDSEGNDIVPDVVIIYRGVNDLSHSPISRLDSVSLQNGVPDTDVIDGNANFFAAYYKTVQKLRAAYPSAYIIICTLNVFKRVTYDKFPTRNSLYTLPDMNDAIRKIAGEMGCGLIELDKDGVTFENCYPTYISDSAEMPTHPNNNGHRVMAEKAEKDILYCLNVQQ